MEQQYVIVDRETSLKAENDELRAKLANARDAYRKLKREHDKVIGENGIDFCLMRKRITDAETALKREKKARAHDAEEARAHNVVSIIVSATCGFGAAMLIVWLLLNAG